MADARDILMSAMLPTELLDDDDDKTQSEVVGDAIVQYDFLQIIENIGRDEFKEIYLNFIDDIKKQSFLNQKILIEHIIDKIEIIYDFSFPEKINISDISDIDDFYRFVEFLEYDNIDFLIEILKNFNIDFLKTDPYEFCTENAKEIIENISKYNKVNFSFIFLNLYETLENNIILNIIYRMIRKNKALISNELKLKELGGL